MDFLHETLKGSLQEGEYVATISSYKETTRYGKKYLEVILETKDGSIADYWTEKSFYFKANAIRRQLGIEWCEMTLIDLIEAVNARTIIIAISYSKEYGLQINYNPA